MKLFITSIFIILLLSCTKKEVDNPDKIPFKITNKKIDYINITTHSIEGDFDGNGQKEEIISFISDSTGRIIDRIPAGEDWSETIDFVLKNGINTKLYIKDQKSDTLKLGPSTGVYCLINLGDINKDNKDEFVTVAEWPDFSNINTARIYTLCNNKWFLIKTFGVNEGIAFDWEGDTRPEFKNIPRFLINDNHKWIYADYNDEDYDGKAENMKPLVIPKCK